MKREDLLEYKDNKEWLEKRKFKIETEYEKIQKMIENYQEDTRYSPIRYDCMAENLAILLDMKLEALNFTIQLEQKLKKIEQSLLKMKQPYQNILTNIYIHGNSLVTVANNMNCNYKDVCKKHGEALKKYEEL